MRKFNVTVDGRTYEVEVEELCASAAVAAPAPVAVAPVAAPVAAPAAAPAAPKAAPAPKKVATPANGTKLEAPMPGMVVTFKVEDGTQVKKGDPVVVLEAMKMENDITAPCDGVFKAVATKGSNVNTGDVLAVIG